MKEYIESLKKSFQKYCNLIQEYQTAMDALVHLEFDNKQQVIDDIRQRRNKADEKMKDYFNAIRALQKICTHTLSNNSSAFEKITEDLEVCSICGYELRKNFKTN